MLITDCILQIPEQMLPWAMTFQGQDIQSAPEELHAIFLCVCVRCVFISIVLCCDHNKKTGRLLSRRISMATGYSATFNNPCYS